nr:MAG TPA: hypothetical protein [Caudoviricetes sp.]
MSIFVPKKVNVGFQNRKDTYTGKLAYVIYFDETGKLRKEPSWQGWRDKQIPNEIYDNEPIEGFVLNKKVGGDRYSWNPRQTYTRVYDPRGFEFEITIPNLLWILENCNCIKGKGLEGKFVYGWEGKELLLVPVESPDYKEIEEKSQIRNNNEFIAAKDLIVGGTYETIEGEQYVFMGKFKPWDRECNEYSWAYRSSSNYGNYEYPLDDSWRTDKINSYRWGGHPIYYRQKQKAKNEFFFIYLNEDGKHRAEHMTKANKKFVRLVSETRSDYPDMVDILNRYSDYSPEDLEADKMLELPFERFKKMADAAMKEHCWKNFSVGKQKDSHLEPVRVQWNNETNQWVISERVVKTREKYRGWSLVSLGTETVEEIEEKKFDSLEECYDYIHPFYGERYLKNGYLKERYYYGK